MSLKCCACLKFKPRDHFSSNQKNKKKGARRCKDCVSEGRPVAERKEIMEESGKCRVKDVQRRYGHLCEIPIQAYREAGVATSWNDDVTKSDIDRASDAWDARSILHDIDTQWGSMPRGGAYSESNYYYGPGEYDYY